MCPKKISKSQLIGRKWIRIISDCCENIGFLFREMPIDDFWIDWEIEVLKNNEDFWEKYQVQVKTSGKFKIDENGLKVRSVSIDDLTYWSDDINIPVFMIWVEESSGKCYWIDTFVYYSELKKNKWQKTISVYAKVTNEICLENKNRFEGFLQDYNIRVSKQNLKKSSPLENFKITSEEKGYISIPNRNKNTLPIDKSPIMVFSNESDSIELFETESSKAHPITGWFCLTKPLWENNFEIKNFKLNFGEDTIISFDSWRVNFMEINETVKIAIITENYRQDINAEKKIIDGKVSIIWSNIDWSLEIEVHMDEKKIHMGVEFHFDKCSSVRGIKSLLNFLPEFSKNSRIEIESNWKISTLSRWEVEYWMEKENEIFSEYIKLLNIIELKYGCIFNIWLVIEWFSEYIQNDTLKIYLKALTNGREIIQKCTFSGELTTLHTTNFTWEQFFRVIINPITILWISLQGVELNLQWKGFMKKDNNIFSINCQEAEVIVTNP